MGARQSMLAALQAVEAWWDDDGDGRLPIDMVRAAIAQALVAPEQTNSPPAASETPEDK